MKVYYHKNGRFDKATGSSIFKQSDNANTLSIKVDWPLDSVVVAKFLLPYPEDDEQYGQYSAESLLLDLVPNVEEGGFVWAKPIPGGYLVNSGTAYLSVQITTQDQKTIIKTTEQVEFIIEESGDYIASPVLPEMTEQILAKLAGLDYSKVDRFDATKINDFLPDGIKGANAFYYNTNYNVVDSVNYLGEKTYAEYSGTLIIGIAQTTDKITQTEMFLSTGRTWQRVIEFEKVNEEWTRTKLGEFVEVGLDVALKFVQEIEDDVQTALEKSKYAETTSNEAKQIAQEAYTMAEQAQMQEIGVGTYATDDMTNIAAQLDAFVIQETGNPPEKGNVVIVVYDRVGATDQNFKYSYGINGWYGYEIPAIQLATNSAAGIVKGNMDTSNAEHMLIDIVNGVFMHIYIRNLLGNYVDLADYLNDVQNQTNINLASLNSAITRILNGTDAVGNALKLNGKLENALNVLNSVSATNDSEGHNISQFYLPRAQGLTQAQADNRYLSKQFGVPYFIANGYLSKSIPTTPADGVQYSVTSNQAGVDITLFRIDHPLEYQVEFTSANAFELIAQLAFNRDAVVIPKMNVYVKAISKGETDFTFIASSSLDPQSFTEETITPINLKNYFTFIPQGNVIDLAVGDILRVEMLLSFQESAEVESRLYDNTNYVSSITLTNIQTIIVNTGNAGAYTQEIQANSWNLNEDNQYYLSIPQATHKIDPSTAYIIDIKRVADIGYQQVLCPQFVNSNGDVTIFTDEAFEGVITIAGGIYKQPSGNVYDSDQIGISNPSLESVNGNATTQNITNEQAVAAINTLNINATARQNLGEIKVVENNTNLNLTTINTFYKQTIFNTQGAFGGNIVVDIANSRISGLPVGLYKINMFETVSASADCLLSTNLYINGLQNPLSSGAVSLKSNELENIVFSGLINITADNSYIELYSAASANISLLVANGSLVIERIS